MKRALIAALFLAFLPGVTPTAQTPPPPGLLVTRGVNMVAGKTWPNGDPYLQRQNEPSVAASTRNPQHLLAGANDYRTVDLPNLSTGPETGDAWLGLFKSVDGGERWSSTLLPGYPQDTSPEGIASPLKGFQAGADPVVRSGTNGLLYYSGLAFDRGPNLPSAVFMARFVDNNNTENGDPIQYLGTTIIDQSTGADFIDKPWMAVDIPRSGAATCQLGTGGPAAADKPGVAWGRYQLKKKDATGGLPPPPKPVVQRIQAGRIYVAYSRITTTATAVESRIMFSQSNDCGVTWTKPIRLSPVEDQTNQGATVSIDPKSGAVYVAWRQFGLTATATDSVMVTRLAFGGQAFSKPAKVHRFNAHRPTDRLRRMIAEHQVGDADEVAEIQPFDQGTAEDRFRTNAYPTMAIDDDGRAYLAWTERGFSRMPGRSSAVDGDARVVMATSRDGIVWTAPQAVDAGGTGADQPGHQLMPSVAFAAGKLLVVYYDLREDVSRTFGPFVDESDAVLYAQRRHTIDIRAAYAGKGDVPVFGPSVQLSQYMVGSVPGTTEIKQLQYNAPALPLFKLGTVPFMGDYIDLAPSPAFVQSSTGVWGFNTAPAAAPVFHVVWTDNRDVQKPADGDWTNYTPVGAANAPGKYPGAPACTPGQAGMRNQNIYSARLTWGLVAGSPGNTKPLSTTMPRGFVVFAQNTATTAKTFRFSIAAQPTGGVASFTQSSQAGAVYPLTSLDVTVAPKSMVTRTVFVTSSDAKAQVPVDIREVAGPGLPLLSGGLTSRVLLNPDVSNPEISNPEISNPEISNPEISNAEIYNPEISNPEISNPEISNPEISNPEISNPEISNARIANPEISNPEISNPEISNPEISNPEISNPEISNADIANGAITDVTWRVVNTGNTTTSFNVNLFLADAAAKLAGPGGSGVTGGIKTQLVVHKFYSTPIAIGCELKQEPHTVLVANVPFPTFRVPGTSTAFDPTNPSVSNTTLWLEPGGEGRITLRIVDPNPQDNITLDPVHDVTPVVTAEPKNTPDLGSPTTPPPSTTPPPAPNTTLAITAQPSDTPLSAAIAPITVHVAVNGAPAAGAQVTIAIAINPAGGHLAGTTTILTDAAGNATFSGLSIDRAGVGYRLSASASASGALPYLSAPFTIGVAAPPLPPSSWTATGDGVVALANDGLAGGTPRMTYANNGFGIFNGAWTVSTVAASNGAVRLDWEWSGFHSYCLASVQLVAFVNRNGVDVFTSPLLQLTDNCVGAQNPSASFDFAGGMPLSVQANDRFGFRLAGSHNDGTYVMEGAFGVVVNGATSASPYVVTNASDGGPGSLRAALAAANAAPDLNTITFAIPGAWVHNIAPATPLPVVSNPVVIDGLSQPGAASMAPTVNINGRFMQGQISDALGHYYGDDLPGTNIGLAPGFEVTASNVTIRGLGINGFPGPGVYVHNLTSGVRVEDSAIGAGLPGVHTWPSNGSGVHVNYASNAVIARNVISSSRASGIIVAGGSGHSVTANRIGTSLDGLAALPNGDNGITLYDGASGTIIDGNLISGNGVFGQPNGHGIDIQQSGALAQVTNTVIRNNVIGLDANGNLLVRGTTLFALGFGPVERGNAGDGIHVNSAPGTIVGGVGTGNVIAGNRFSGVAILGTPSGATPRIIGNRIGTNPAGTAARGNGREGVQVFLSSAIVGEPGVGAGNLVSGNISEGVQANGNTIVENNLIGTDVTGTLQLGNGRLDDVGDPNDPGCCHTGVFVDAPNNIVRGNVVAGSGGAGIRSDGGSGGGRNIIEDNKVGTDITGTFGIPNGEGIGLYNDQSTTIVRRNLVAYNSAIGIRLVEGTAGAMVGGLNVLDANIVRGNGGPGVAVGYSAATAETANSILSNAIYGNGSQAIDLGHNGPTANDAGDGDTGPNGLQNRPVIASAVNTTTTTVDFTLDGGAGTFLVQFFGGSVCGAAEQLIGSTSVGSGSTVFNLSVLVPAGTWITATATDAAGSTSELSPCVQVSGLSPSAVIASASPANGAVYVRLPAGQPLGAVPSASVGAGMSPVQSRPAPTAPPEPAWFEPGRQLP